ncbi:MAG: GNAT family N-acetyltransferase [Alphaproteobacteria bacterium]|nr:GNAT family N-acetyltransferase [Alphaproteobacteria bacterium]
MTKGLLRMIRKAITSDAEPVRACARLAYGKYVSRIGREPAPMVADFEAQIRQGLVCVSEADDGVLQGFAVFYPRENHLHLENIAVAPEHQGKGIGKGLMDACEGAARDLGLGAVELYTNLKMTENLTLYPALGYVEIGRRSEHGFDRVFFRKTV